MRRVQLSRLWFSLALALGLAFAGASAALAAGETMTMDDLQLSIMPEYDAMNVIVVSSGTFVNDTGRPFQGKLVWLMPKGGEVFMLCETENGMACQAYTTDTGNPEYNQITWRPSRVIQPGEKFPVMFEYTMNNFSAPGERKFTVPFRPTFPVRSLSVEFKQPKDSANLVLNPASAKTSVDAEGFTNHYYDFSSVKPLQLLSFTASYTRNQTRPSKEAAKQGSAATPGGGGASNPLTAWLFAGIAAALGLIMFFGLRGADGKGAKGRGRAGGQKPSQPSKPPKPEKPAKAAGDPKVREEKKKIRKMLLDGKIGEETYRRMIADLEDEE